MNGSWIVGLLAAISPACLAAANEPVSGTQTMADLLIPKVLAAEYSAYKKSLAGDNGSSDIRACLALLAKSREALAAAAPCSDRKRDAFDAYRQAWGMCLRMRRDSKDKVAQQLIVDQWNSRLKDDGDAVCAQIYALEENWDRTLLTTEFWCLFRQTERAHTISAMSLLFYSRGDPADMKILAGKRDSGLDLKKGRIIQNAINWFECHRRGDDTKGREPAALSPAHEYPPCKE